MTIQNFTTNVVHRLLQEAQRRNIWGYVAVAFNKVDIDRRRLVGPNRLCAEWVLKNGGGVKFVEYPTKFFREYNSLPPENTRLKIQVVDAKDASIMKIGLEHFDGCKHIDTVFFDNCKHLEEDGLEGLIYLERTLKLLQVSSCDNIVDEGLHVIGKLKQLEHLILYNMHYVKNMNAVLKQLQAELPRCKIATSKK